jgi:hypothetical protein
LYRNKRVAIFDTKDDASFGLKHEMVIWDHLTQLEVGWADKLSDGSY